MDTRKSKDQLDADRRLKSRRDEVWACLADVTDPELDESVTELNFVTHVDVDPDNRVHVGFRLPTYWCAANFSFLMADDMRQAVLALDWVEGVTVVLGEHMYADKINAGLAQGLSFQDTFGVEADGDVEEVRRTFLVKAFQRRQVALLNHLTAAGFSPTEIVALTLDGLEQLPVDEEGQRLVRRYLDRRGVVGPMLPTFAAFITAEGAKLTSEGFAVYVSSLRRVGINAEFNSALCRGLLSVRFDLETPFVPSHKAPSATSGLQSPA